MLDCEYENQSPANSSRDRARARDSGCTFAVAGRPRAAPRARSRRAGRTGSGRGRARSRGRTSCTRSRPRRPARRTRGLCVDGLDRARRPRTASRARPRSRPAPAGARRGNGALCDDGDEQWRREAGSRRGRSRRRASPGPEERDRGDGRGKRSPGTETSERHASRLRDPRSALPGERERRRAEHGVEREQPPELARARRRRRSSGARCRTRAAAGTAPRRATSGVTSYRPADEDRRADRHRRSATPTPSAASFAETRLPERSMHQPDSPRASRASPGEDQPAGRVRAAREPRRPRPTIAASCAASPDPRQER